VAEQKELWKHFKERQLQRANEGKKMEYPYQATVQVGADGVRNRVPMA